MSGEDTREALVAKLRAGAKFTHCDNPKPHITVKLFETELHELSTMLREAASRLAAPVEPHECRSWPGGWTCHICGKHYSVAVPDGARTHITWDKDGNRIVTPLDSEGKPLAAPVGEQEKERHGL